MAASGPAFNPADYPKNCHAGALALVRTYPPGKARVARGWAYGVPGQHSWVVFGDPYVPELILDPTIWSYQDREPGILLVEGKDMDTYIPHGKGRIWDYGPPATGIGEMIPLEVADSAAKMFLDMIGPLDRAGWSNLANGPMQGWPSGPVIEAMDDHPALKGLVPIDILGMVTDRNPGNLYF